MARQQSVIRHNDLQPRSRFAGLLPLARLAWVLFALALTALTIVAVPARYDELRSTGAATESNAVELRFVASVDSSRVPLQLTAADEAALPTLNLTIEAYAAFVTALELVFLAASSSLGLVMFWRRSVDWMALFTSLTFVVFGQFYVPVLSALVRANYAWRFPVVSIIALATSCAVAFCFVFPNGRFVPRWTWVIVASWCAWTAMLTVYVPANPFNWPPALFFILFVSLAIVISSAQTYRYWRVSTFLQRQQTKPFVVGVVASLIAYVLFNFDVLGRILPALRQPGSTHVIYNLVSLPLYLLFVFLPGLAIAIAILRYRLWDIDFILRRTVIYSLLTAALSLIYTGAVIVLLSIFQRVAPGLRSALAVSLSTIVIAALFAPLRNSFKNAIDRRFYRRRYNAEDTLTAFGAQVRAEVDLSALTAKLIAAVNDTMHPAHASVWLRSKEHKF